MEGSSGSGKATNAGGEGVDASSLAEVALDADDDPPSSSSSHDGSENQAMENMLSTFRSQWQKEIKNDIVENPQRDTGKGQQKSEENLDNTEHRAKELFLQGVENEKKGRVYEAIQFYRKAVQLVPDIEFRLYDNIRKDRPAADSAQNKATDAEGNKKIAKSEDVKMKLQNWLCTSPALCMPAAEQRTTHISSLPVEILLLIFRWVVSRDLDIRSLEMCSLVCRGFYCCARDPEIWRIICMRLWGTHCQTLKNSSISWRDIYLQNPHLLFSGCYISKTTYVRHGENSFQDQFYRPWHLVEYYRYLRFFPEGRVLMMTTAEGPGPMVGHLKDRSARYPAVIVGHYRLTCDIVTLVLTRSDPDKKNNRYRGRNNRAQVESTHQTYNIELELRPWKGHRNWQLSWMRYRVLSRRGVTETATNFEVLNNKFPPFWFSRVKSYTGESEQPLN